jgi:DNA-binding MarR family transcriptional regulator
MSTGDDGTVAQAATPEQLDAVMLAVQALVGVAAQSVSEVENRVTLPQLRVLVLVSSRGTSNLNALAQAMGVHPSNASRSCDRLVAGGLLRRRESSVDRRNLVLELTHDGRELLDVLIAHRRAAVAEVLQRVPESRRRSLVNALRAFGQAAGEGSAEQSWKLGWGD